jgi:hypothetical protein
VLRDGRSGDISEEVVVRAGIGGGRECRGGPMLAVGVGSRIGKLSPTA